MSLPLDWDKNGRITVEWSKPTYTNMSLSLDSGKSGKITVDWL